MEGEAFVFVALFCEGRNEGLVPGTCATYGVRAPF